MIWLHLNQMRFFVVSVWVGSVCSFPIGLVRFWTALVIGVQNFYSSILQRCKTTLVTKIPSWISHLHHDVLPTCHQNLFLVSTSPTCFSSFPSNLFFDLSAWVSHMTFSSLIPPSSNGTLLDLQGMRTSHLYLPLITMSYSSLFFVCSRTLQSLPIFQKILTINLRTRTDIKNS